MVRIAGLAALGMALIVPVVAPAQKTQYGKQAIGNWLASDKCAMAAQKAFPDYTSESNAKRDNLLKQCLEGGNLPPRNSLDTRQ